MKKGTKKIAALLTAVGLALSMIGCGSADEESGESSSVVESSTTTSTSESKQEVEEPVELVVYMACPPSGEDEKVFAAANEYIQETLGFTVDFVYISQGEYAEKMKMNFSSGAYFDVCFTAEWVDFYINVANGVYLPLDDLLPVQGKDVYEIASTVDGLLDAASVNGNIYAVPHMKDFVYPQVFMLKIPYAEKYNIDVTEVDTLEEIEPILQTIKDNEEGIIPLLLKSNDNLSKVLPFERLSPMQAIAFDLESGELVSIYETDEMKEFLNTMRDWNLKGFFPADVETRTSLGDITSAGNFAASVGAWVPYADQSTTNKVSPNYMGRNFLGTGGAMGAAWAISAETEHPEESMEFINLIDTDPYLRNLMAYGIEGVHYIKVDEAHYNFPEGMTKQSETGYTPWVYGQASTYELLVKEGQPEDYWDVYKEINENAKPSPAIGFTVDLSTITTEIAALQNVFNEYAYALETGAIDPEENLPKFVDKLYSVGLQKVMDEVNDQYKAWQASKQ